VFIATLPLNNCNIRFGNFERKNVDSDGIMVYRNSYLVVVSQNARLRGELRSYQFPNISDKI